ncbi:restriction endonuclease subunit S [Pseudoalteromonas sp. MM17-2]|uniref:restriction endonuclease subunit S n=1 Tax=Pseudoalteromonas sp. MM17-2 TaxID=2917753 RepID=UPI001EF46F28|nr:restriction endonuclease subunit S [Pseudoalteromonas sp. MM17-2]MCG7543531.1 restriction endonuclease subunit S [Pseudoalteromonas sp. MM17-2]
MKLGEIAEIRSGRTFKNGVPESDAPTHSVIQLRDFDKDEDQRPIKWDQLNKTDLSNSKVDSSLKVDDILIVAKGPIKKAIYLSSVPKNIVANQHFFIISAKANSTLSQQFLAYYLNSSDTQRWMLDNSSGSYQSTLSKKTLSELPIPNVSDSEQKLIVEAADSVRTEIQLHQLLIKGRQQEMDAVFVNLWKNLS